MIKYTIITLFPELFINLAGIGMVSKAIKKQLLSLEVLCLRDFVSDGKVDDQPFGGGSGMVMKYEPFAKAIHNAKLNCVGPVQVVYMSPAGKTLTQCLIQELSLESNLIILCGRYAGIDERIIETFVDQEVSIGDYILSGGEVPAMALIESTARLIPGVLANPQSLQDECFADNLLNYPHYTRPENIDGKSVPEVLLSGNHQHIKAWRSQQRLIRTKERRPDLTKKYE